MGSESPDVWPRTSEISFGNTEVTRHEFYECFEQDIIISGKEVKIRVRDRSVNLVRVRIQHFKFDYVLSLLNKRLREYGVISRIFWDTYQDRSLPRWNGIKTGVVNVDMEIHKGIPSYITFGSYKDPLMVSYAGQMHTCRMCDSPTHVLANCPKQPRSLTNPSTISKGPMGTRRYSSVLLTNRAPVRTTVRKPQETGPIGSGYCLFLRLGRGSSFDTGGRHQFYSRRFWGNDVPPAPIAPGVPSTIYQMDNEVVEEMVANELFSISNPEEDVSFSGGSIQPGQRPLDSQEASHVSETQESLGVPLGTPSTPIEDKTLKAMEAVRRKKANDNKAQPSKPKYKY
ncbi:hypothetical protein DAPPUDRAFT_116139 [Daphnia pulex]|uniref:Uncharacterized protein n=1 Tax=Daphnia pulex TaxID=6669 RepID=E9HNP5_DAPPU|nr:hypothetical protein DAPPUDRAFT_116139 [Daphnia pulex]|eukprot:EFX66646.1 hypothetical protein DAPPUDRAFT_116139 [Daphnia pulex]